MQFISILHTLISHVIDKMCGAFKAEMSNFYEI